LRANIRLFSYKDTIRYYFLTQIAVLFPEFIIFVTIMKEKEGSYKQAFNRLQEIQELIESNKPDVDELTSILKEASGLLKICKDKLFVVSEETKKILESIN
jgi:exodeoxyribonuclease VII small subunit